MSQSNYIALFLFAAFVVFVTLRGELPRYLAVFGLGSASGAAPSEGDVFGAIGRALQGGFSPSAPASSSAPAPPPATTTSSPPT